MLIVLVIFSFILFPYPIAAQDVTPEPTATPSATLTPVAETEPTPIPTQGPSATPTNTPTSLSPSNNPTPTKQKQTVGSQTGGFGGDGLVEEKDVDTGLGFEKDKVLGTSTSKDIDSTGDKDLLSTLIFLTAAIVLIVWTVYMILVQKGIIKSAIKKTQHRGGITPQPLE